MPALVWAQTAGKITKVSGPVYVMKTPSKPFEKAERIDAKAGVTVYWSDTLRTEAGARVRMQLNDGSILSLGQQTGLKVNKHDERTQQSDFELIAGRVRANVVHQGQPNSSFVIRTNSTVLSVLDGGDFVVDADSPVATVVVVLASLGEVSMQSYAGGPGPIRRLKIPGGFYASSSEGILHPVTAEMLGLMNLGFTLSKKLSDTFVFLQSESRNDPMGTSGLARHPLTTLVVPISRGRYVL
jgi:hypothetical protein